MTDRYADFLAGERPDDVALYLTEAVVSNVESLADRTDAVARADGVVLVVEGERGRRVFSQFAGTDAMQFARSAMGTDGRVAADLADGECPSATGADASDHDVAFVFAFAEAQNEAVGGLYAEGDVLHAYARCECGTAYADRWVCGDRESAGERGGGSDEAAR